MPSNPSPKNSSPPLRAGEDMLLAFVAERDAQYHRISRFLHDEVGQVLSAAGLQLEALRLDFASQAPEFTERVGEIQKPLQQVIDHIRDLSYELNPSIVQRTNLQFALERLATRVQSAFPLTVRRQFDPAVRVPTPQGEAMYRAAESALEAVKCSESCARVEFRLKRTRSEYVLELHLDCAVDFDNDPSFPVLLMRHYAERGGLSTTVNKNSEKDIIIRFSCPAVPV